MDISIRPDKEILKLLKSSLTREQLVEKAVKYCKENNETFSIDDLELLEKPKCIKGTIKLCLEDDISDYIKSVVNDTNISQKDIIKLCITKYKHKSRNNDLYTLLDKEIEEGNGKVIISYILSKI